MQQAHTYRTYDDREVSRATIDRALRVAEWQRACRMGLRHLCWVALVMITRNCGRADRSDGPFFAGLGLGKSLEFVATDVELAPLMTLMRWRAFALTEQTASIGTHNDICNWGPRSSTFQESNTHSGVTERVELLGCDVIA
jgi:hypothetical protein